MIPINVSAASFSFDEASSVLTPLILYIVGMVVYGIFVFKFYRFLSRKNIFELNLSQYNTVSHPFLNKMAAMFFYVLEYIFIFPLFVFFWFLIITGLLSVLSRGELQNILLIAMAIVAAARITAYYNEELSKDMAKMIPFALLGVFIVDISFFSFSESIELLKQIPSLWKIAVYYLLLTVILEILLRIGDTLVRLFVGEKEE